MKMIVANGNADVTESNKSGNKGANTYPLSNSTDHSDSSKQIWKYQTQTLKLNALKWPNRTK